MSSARRSRRRPLVRGLELVFPLLAFEVDGLRELPRPAEETLPADGLLFRGIFGGVVPTGDLEPQVVCGQRLQSLGSGFGQDVAPAIVANQPPAESGPR